MSLSIATRERESVRILDLEGRLTVGLGTGWLAEEFAGYTERYGITTAVR